MNTTAAAWDADRRRYDAIIVGAGWSGSLIAERLGAKGWQVLVLEAGNGGDETWEGHLDSVRTFHSAVAKVPNSPHRRNTAAPSPDVLDLAPVRDPKPGRPEFTAGGYLVQKGRLPYGTDYLRSLGGSGMHWLGAVPRMRDDDFSTDEDYDYGRDWPIGAEDLQRHYAEAERAMGVSGDADEQRRLGVVTDPDYTYPMHGIPQSHIDQYCQERLPDREIRDEVGGESYRINVTGLPQARNGTPNPGYAGGAGYRPKGAVGLPNYGERCVGNASCVPICPVQARSTPVRIQAGFSGSVTVATRSVATRVLRGRGDYVRGVEYRAYGDPATPVSRSYTAEADVVVLAAHAIENARLLLFSGLAKGSGQVGRNLMDHPTMVAWGLTAAADGNIGPFRGPGHTSGWEEFRFGGARAKRAPFRIEIGNWGWGWANGAPMSNVATALGVGGDAAGEVRGKGVFGAELRSLLGSAIGRQLQLQCAVEQAASVENKVTIEPSKYRDALGNPRPVIEYDLDEHTRKGVYAAYLVAGKIFAAMGAQNHTDFRPIGGVPPLGHFEHQGQNGTVHLAYHGAGHGAGTHIMGDDAADSVVDSYQRTHDHPNLYAAGCGSMPSIGTSNPTLTMAALALRSAERIHQDLAELHGAVLPRPRDRKTEVPA
ncbi:GMC family oxidoreductase [Nocardiopsis sp. CNT-189]|uniref:GMC oxidoreductase n=1 Tax=Nocardiopsis oceanisediminis TaxID=2816862 RepID=UPI003B2E9B4D